MDSIAHCYSGACYGSDARRPLEMPPRPSEMKLNNNKNPSPRSLAEALQQAGNLDGSLNSRLSAYRDHCRKIRPDFVRAYDELIERLGVLDRGAVGPQVGEPMPEFALPDEMGRLVSLSELRRSGPVVITINRGHWCPYCKLDLRALAAAHDRIAQLGARVVSIMPDSAAFTSKLSDESKLRFPVLSDTDLGYLLSLGLIFWVGSEIQQMYRDVGLELERYHGNSGQFLPMAAKFVVGRNGIVQARQVNIEFRERMEPEAIVAVLERLRQEDR